MSPGTLSCPVCEAALPHHEVGPPRLARCPICALGYTDPPPPSSAPPGFAPVLPPPARWRRAVKRVLVQMLGRAAFPLWGIGLPPRGGARALDIGCGAGLYVRALRDLGWRAWGVEMNPHMLTWATNGPPALALADGHALPFAGNTFNAIFFWHVLEHLARPDRALREARACLRSGGILLLEVPNLGSVQARLFGPRWFHLALHTHHWHFQEHHVRRLLKKAGFTPLRVWSAPNGVGWVESIGVSRRWNPLFWGIDLLCAATGKAGVLRALAV